MSKHVFISAIILLSGQSERLAEFYRTSFGIPLQETDHQGSIEPHYECELGDVHFAIHADGNGNRGQRSGCFKIALAVADIGAVIRHLRSLNIHVLYEPESRGFAVMTAIEDPDGNLVEITQLTSSWIGHLRSRNPSQRDVTTLET